MQVYELSYLILPSIPEEGLSAVVEKLKGLVAQAGGAVFAEEAPIQMDLAYEMTKVVGASRYVVNEAFIGWLKFEAEPTLMPQLAQELGASPEVLRHLLIKAPRETEFTFAKAREALQKEANGGEEAEVEAPAEVAVE